MFKHVLCSAAVVIYYAGYYNSVKDCHKAAVWAEISLNS